MLKISYGLFIMEGFVEKEIISSLDMEGCVWYIIEKN